MTRQARPRTGDQALVREINLSLIMNELREEAPISRATLAEITGLNKTTVSSLVHELIQHQYVHEVGYDTSGIGRPAVLLELNPAAGCILSAEIGVDFISVIRTNFSAEVTWRRKIDIQDTSQPTTIERALALLHEALEEANSSGANLLGLTLGVPGLVDYQAGSLLFAPNLGWHDVPLGEILSEAFDAPIIVDNEANLAALGEHYFGAARGYDDALYISVGVGGLGGGIIRNGQVFRGKAGLAGEFGHMTAQPDGLPCKCGSRGCWETLVSQNALFRLVREAINNGASSRLSDLTGGDLSQLTVGFIVEAAREGDHVARQALEQVGRHLGVGIASLINAFDPELVVFGGALSDAAEFLLPVVEEEIRQRTVVRRTSPTEVVVAHHGYDACAMGGVAAVLQAILSTPSHAVRERRVSSRVP
jgi:glucokinase-like ROK family protein